MSIFLSGLQLPVDWRWKQAQDMLVRCAITIDSCFASDYLAADPYLRLAHELLLLLGKDELRLIHAVQRKKVRRELEYAVLAYGLQRKNSLLNWVFKALILSNAPAEITLALLSRDELYSTIHNALFFDVADRLADETYIWNHVIDTDPRSGLASHSAAAILLECAYLGGWQRFLTLLASIAQNFPEHALACIWASSPILAPYGKPSNASDLARRVIQERMRPDIGRTIDDLRKLYRSIPIIGGGTGASAPGKPQPLWEDGQISTFYDIVDDSTGQRRRRSAELFSK